MKYILTILTFLTFQLAVGQDNRTQTELLLTYFNKQFDSLAADSGVADLEQKFGVKLKSIASCINPSLQNRLNEDEVQLVCRRLQEISLALFKESTPIILSFGGMGNIDQSEKLNKKKNKFNVTFIGFGDGCIILDRDVQYQDAFNNQTLRLLNTQTVDEILE